MMIYDYFNANLLLSNNLFYMKTIIKNTNYSKYNFLYVEHFQSTDKKYELSRNTSQIQRAYNNC